jgi:hypothetical protein
MAVPATPRTINGSPNPEFSSLGLIAAAALGLTDSRFNNTTIQNIPNMDGFPNGRRLEDDVTTIELQAVGGVVLAAIGLFYDDYDPNTTATGATPSLFRTVGFTAGPTANDTAFKTSFPFVQGPWRGFVGQSYVGPTAATALPASFLAFNAEKIGNQVQLTWDVTNEVNNDRYEVEHTTGNGGYKKIGTVNGRSGNANTYRFTHGTPAAATNFYRIKQVDRDGKSSYSPIRSVKFDSKSVMSITPNPATTFIRVSSDKPGLQISLFDNNGKKLASKVAANGIAEFDIANLPKGSYMVVAEDKGVRLETRKIVKQ